MILSEPGRTDYDLKFSIFGFDVRVHPLFFVIPALLGYNAIPDSMNTGIGLLIVTAVFFVSILVHELGHTVAFRYYGIPSRIVLYWMGGLAIPDSGGTWSSGSRRSLNPNQQIVVSAAGPVFGLLIAVALIGIVFAFGGSVSLIAGDVLPRPQLRLAGTILAGSESIGLVIWFGIILNVFLNLVNLLPVYPLDGGQIARQIMVQMDRYNGVRNSIYLSIGVSAMLAVFFFVVLEARFGGFFFGYMAWSSYQMLQQYQTPRW